MGISTTWLVTALWRYELGRGERLVEFLVTKNISGDIRVIWNPDIYAEWPSMARTWGFRMDDDWVLNLGIEHAGGRGISVTENPTATAVRYDSAQESWGLLPSLERIRDSSFKNASRH